MLQFVSSVCLLQLAAFADLVLEVDATDGQSRPTDWGPSCFNKYFSTAPTHFAHYTFFFTATISCGFFRMWDRVQRQTVADCYKGHNGCKLVLFKHFQPSRGSFKWLWLFWCIPQLWETLLGRSGIPYQSCELPQHGSRAQPSALVRYQQVWCSTLSL